MSLCLFFPGKAVEHTASFHMKMCYEITVNVPARAKGLWSKTAQKRELILHGNSEACNSVFVLCCEQERRTLYFERSVGLLYCDGNDCSTVPNLGSSCKGHFNE